MKKALIILLAFLAGYTIYVSYQGSAINQPEAVVQKGDSDAVMARAFANRSSNLQVEGQGRVEALLADDIAGSRHQKFILRLESGQTLLIAHNIDLAPRLRSLQKGDTVAFSGEYEWNTQGGVVHWTHRDPDGSHVAGWLQHNGRIFQ